MSINHSRVSVIIPCLNEEATVYGLVEDLISLAPTSEIIIVDDGSSPPVTNNQKASVLRHPHTLGNGAAIKTGARAANGEILVFMDADGQHKPAEIPMLLNKLDENYDMVVGARNYKGQASILRLLANKGFNRLASIMTGHRIQDLTSGFRAVRARQFRNFLYLLPNGFSYPTTSTMAFFRCGYSVAYIPITTRRRKGRSKIRLLKDGVRFFIIILKIGALFSPMRFFLPISAALFLIASSYYGYTYYTDHRFTNMSALLYISSMLTFLIGILSEQISSLHYRNSEERRRSAG